MASFFEKLRKGMGVEVSETEEEPVQKKRKLREIEAEEEPSESSVKKRGLEESPMSVVKAEEESKKIAKEKEKWFEQEGQLAVDVYQTNGELVIQSTIAGVKAEELDISIEGDNVLIKGRREKPPEEGEISYFYQECYWGAFSRQIILPEEADPGRADATMKEGILTIRIPKIEREKRRKIVVKALG